MIRNRTRADKETVSNSGRSLGSLEAVKTMLTTRLSSRFLIQFILGATAAKLFKAVSDLGLQPKI